MTQREIVAKAIYEAPGHEAPWEELSAERRRGWLEDADRVLSALVCADCGHPVVGRPIAEQSGISG